MFQQYLYLIGMIYLPHSLSLQVYWKLWSADYSNHLRQNCLYSEEVNKNPAELSYLNVLLIYQYYYLPKKKIYWTKKQRSDDGTFAMTSCWTKK